MIEPLPTPLLWGQTQLQYFYNDDNFARASC